MLGDKTNNNMDAAGGISGIDVVRYQSDRGQSSQILKSTKVQSFQMKEAITVRDFDDRGIILIQDVYILCFWSCWSNNTLEKCCIQNIPKVQDRVQVECLSC